MDVVVAIVSRETILNRTTNTASFSLRRRGAAMSRPSICTPIGHLAAPLNGNTQKGEGVAKVARDEWREASGERRVPVEEKKMMMG